MQRVEADAVDKLGRLGDVPNGKVGLLAGFQRADGVQLAQRTRGLAGDAGNAFFHGQRKQRRTMFMVSSSEVSGEVPGLLSVASAMWVPCLRNSSTGGFFVSRMK